MKEKITDEYIYELLKNRDTRDELIFDILEKMSSNTIKLDEKFSKEIESLKHEVYNLKAR